MIDPRLDHLRSIIWDCQEALHEMNLDPADKWFNRVSQEAAALANELQMPSRKRTRQPTADRDGMDRIV